MIRKRIIKVGQPVLIFGLLSVFLLTSCNEGEREEVTENGVPEFAELDVDEDERLTKEEFRNVYNETGYYGEWDANADRGVDEDEWGTALNAQMGPDYEEGEYGNFEDWDADADGVLDERELGDGVFAYYDTDKDSYIVEEEYDVWGHRLDQQKTEDSWGY